METGFIFTGERSFRLRFILTSYVDGEACERQNLAISQTPVPVMPALFEAFPKTNSEWKTYKGVENLRHAVSGTLGDALGRVRLAARNCLELFVGLFDQSMAKQSSLLRRDIQSTSQAVGSTFGLLKQSSRYVTWVCESLGI